MPVPNTYPVPHSHNHPLFTLWHNLHLRTNSDRPQTKTYRENGVTVCKEWATYEPFYQWATTHGYKEGLTIDRISHTDGYSPTNCRFVTMRENCNNRVNTIFVSGKPLSVYCEENGIDYQRGYRLYRKGLLK